MSDLSQGSNNSMNAANTEKAAKLPDRQKEKVPTKALLHEDPNGLLLLLHKLSKASTQKSTQAEGKVVTPKTDKKSSVQHEEPKSSDNLDKLRNLRLLQKLLNKEAGGSTPAERKAAIIKRYKESINKRWSRPPR